MEQRRIFEGKRVLNPLTNQRIRIGDGAFIEAVQQIHEQIQP